MSRPFTPFLSHFLMSWAALMLMCSCSSQKKPISEKHLNVLFIAVDDLRPELGCYGKQHIHSPNIDQLANSGTLFQNSYCNIPVCGASRASLLTGLRPTLTRFKTYTSRADKEAPGILAIPGLFKQAGYNTISNGKIFHNAKDHETDWDEIWKAPARSPRDFVTTENIRLDTAKDTRGRPFEMTSTSDTSYRDGKMTLKAIEDLKRLKETNEPFFLAVGYLKPHLPFNAPRKYWDLYDRQSIALPTNKERPTDVPSQALHSFGELRHYTGIPKKGQVSDSLAKTLIHGYYACVSYTDALVGQLLDALKDLGLHENTVVILWGDHGWNLMEHGLWCKHCNYRTSLKAPIILRVPGYPSNNVRKEMVEFVDIYPTLAEACGLDKPAHLDGTSLIPLLGNEDVPWKNRVESVWHNGFTYTTPTHAYTRWVTDRDSVMAEMLFDHVVDPEENQNIISDQKAIPMVKTIFEK